MGDVDGGADVAEAIRMSLETLEESSAVVEESASSEPVVAACAGAAASSSSTVLASPSSKVRVHEGSAQTRERTPSLSVGRSARRRVGQQQDMDEPLRRRGAMTGCDEDKLPAALGRMALSDTEDGGEVNVASRVRRVLRRSESEVSLGHADDELASRMLRVGMSRPVHAASSSSQLCPEREGADAPTARECGSRRRPRPSPPANASPPVPSPDMKRSAGTSTSLPMLPSFPPIGVSSCSHRCPDGESAAAENVVACHPPTEGGRSDLPRWARFTPGAVDLCSGRCQARTWGGGEGAQCKHKAMQDRLCAVHAKENPPKHGYIDGEIPEPKWLEFVAAAASRESKRGVGSRVRSAGVDGSPQDVGRAGGVASVEPGISRPARGRGARNTGRGARGDMGAIHAENQYVDDEMRARGFQQVNGQWIGGVASHADPASRVVAINAEQEEQFLRQRFRENQSIDAAQRQEALWGVGQRLGSSESMRGVGRRGGRGRK